MRTHYCCIAMLLLVLVFPHAAAAVEPGNGRPRVGLVLGGGGARGAAHIGVLKELERLRVPVDAVAGTSMGAIIGGLYAGGMSPTELEALVKSLDWADAFQDAPKRDDLSYRRKQDDAAFPMPLELGLRDGQLQIPMGLIQGQKLSLILRSQTVGVAHIDDFDQLPVAFRAVASDIVTGEEFVMRNGDLAHAMRASMAAPGFFAPSVVDGHTLVDGGLVGNVPVNVMQAMDVDIIIAVDVEFPLYKPDEIQSALSITAQMLTILIRKETLRQLDRLTEDDLLIRPDLGEFGSTNFAEIAEAVEPGATATRERKDRLLELAVDEAEYQAYLENRQSIVRDVSTVDFVRVNDEGRLSEDVLAARLKTEPGDKLDTRVLAEDAARLYGLELYEQVDYQVVTEGAQTGVEFTTRDKSWGPNFLQFGMLLQDDFEGQTSFNVSSRLTRGAINHLGAEWRTDLQLGTEPYLFTEFYQPLSDNSQFFVAPRVRLEQENFNVFEQDTSIARYRVGEATLGLDVGYQLGLWGEVRVGVFRGTGQAKRKTGSPDLPTLDFDTGGIFSSFNVDTLDNAQIPLEGSRVDLEWSSSRAGMGADFNFETFESRLSHFWTSGRHTISAGLTFNTTVDADDLIQNYFPLGGFLNLSGLQRGEISGPHAAVARLIYYRRSGAMAKNLFDMPLYFGASLETGNAWQSRSDISLESTLLNGSVFAAINTYLGPLFLAAGFGEGGESSFYLIIGSQ